MKSTIDCIKQIHFLKLEKGDDILNSIVEYSKDNNITSGAVVGIGAVEKACLGYFDVSTKKYLENDFNFFAEILNCTGNIALNELTKEHIAHLHMLIGDIKGVTFGGHVLPGNIISVTGEFVIFETNSELMRNIDDEFKLMLLNI